MSVDDHHEGSDGGGLICEFNGQVVEEGSEGFETLRSVVKKAKVILTCAGPFEKYGQALVRLCVEEGVRSRRESTRASIPSDFLRQLRQCRLLARHCKMLRISAL